MGKSQSAIVVAVGMSLALTAANALAQTESANQRIVPPVKSAGVSSFLKYLGVGQLICKSPHASGGWDVTVAPYGDWRVMEVESDHIVVCELSIESRRQLGEASVVPTVLDDSFVVIPVHQIASLVIERDGGGQPAPVVYSRRLPQLPTASGDSIAPPAKATSRAWPLLTSTTPAARTGKTTRAIYRMNPDGSDVQLVACLKEYDFLGTPAESHDGESLACDAWDDDLYNAHLVVMKADGSQPFDFGPGAMPSWSPDDTQIAYHSYGPGASGIWIMNRDGTARKHLVAGTSPRWSHDGARIAYRDRTGRNLAVYDLATGKSKTLLEVGRYSFLKISFSWSSDDSALVYVATLSGGGDELAIVNSYGHSHGLDSRLLSDPIRNNSIWSEDGSKILVRLGNVFAQLDPDDARRIDILAHHADVRRDPTWTLDGEWIMFTSEVEDDLPKVAPAIESTRRAY